ncbi:MAG: RnfABCDGE type electron transport complex subunit D [Bacillota bacterium]
MSNFVVSGTPHVRSEETVQHIMRDVCIALAPAGIMGIYYFGFNAALIIAICVAACIGFEYLYQTIMKKPITISDLSAVVTGLLLAYNIPPSAPFWVPIVGAAFAMIICKQLFGGLGQNFINPALAGRAFLLASYPTEMTTFTLGGPFGADAVAVATPLAILKTGEMPDATMMDVLLGNVGGVIGETSAIALIIGGIYLIARHVINWKIPVIYIGTVFVLTAAIGRDGLRVPHYEIMTGGLMMGAFFMATDYASSPVTPKGQVIFAFCCGLLTTLIRIFGGYPEGVSYSILIMNLAVPLIERYTQPTIFGALPKPPKTKEAK